MDNKFGEYAVLGLLIGAVVGWGMGAAGGNSYLGIALGALAGVFLGWFMAAAALRR